VNTKKYKNREKTDEKTSKIICRQTTNPDPKKEFEVWFSERNPNFTEIPQRRDEDDE